MKNPHLVLFAHGGQLAADHEAFSLDDAIDVAKAAGAEIWASIKASGRPDSDARPDLLSAAWEKCTAADLIDTLKRCGAPDAEVWIQCGDDHYDGKPGLVFSRADQRVTLLTPR